MTDKVEVTPKEEVGVDATVKDKRGVCYLQTIPPKMCQENLRKILSKRFQVERIYLEKENSAITRAR